VRVIGLTGGIGAGKSEVAATLGRLGAAVLDADQEGHDAYAPGTLGWRRITELFGPEMLTETGEIDRRELGQLVFSNPQAMAWLNAAIHPIIRERLSIQLDQLKALGCEVAVVDAAVLVDAGWDDLTDEVWLVAAPADKVMERTAVQRGTGQHEVHTRIIAQEAMIRNATARADVIIQNTGTIAELCAEVERLWKERNLPIRQHR
jgi:dephospho-CoA kinase